MMDVRSLLPLRKTNWRWHARGRTLLEMLAIKFECMRDWSHMHCQSEPVLLYAWRSSWEFCSRLSNSSQTHLGSPPHKILCNNLISFIITLEPCNNLWSCAITLLKLFGFLCRPLDSYIPGPVIHGSSDLFSCHLHSRIPPQFAYSLTGIWCLRKSRIWFWGQSGCEVRLEIHKNLKMWISNLKVKNWIINFTSRTSTNTMLLSLRYNWGWCWEPYAGCALTENLGENYWGVLRMITVLPINNSAILNTIKNLLNRNSSFLSLRKIIAWRIIPYSVNSTRQ